MTKHKDLGVARGSRPAHQEQAGDEHQGRSEEGEPQPSGLAPPPRRDVVGEQQAGRQRGAYLSDADAADVLALLCDAIGEDLDHGGLAARRYALTRDRRALPGTVL
ncbi:MAG: hypothetical protein HOY76_09275 [Streptomyces sp.]|nr:hypothetical protein [Streptomyces sp.]